MRKRRRVALVAAAAVCLLLPALAAGYGRAESIVDRGATLVAGKPIDAGCAVSDAAWELEVEQAFGPGRNVQGYASIGGSTVRLAPWICRALDGDPPASSRHTVGAALNVLAHEASHARGVVDEPTAACEGLAWTDDLAWQVLGVRLARRAGRTVAGQVAQIVAESHAAHALGLPSSRTLCP